MCDELIRLSDLMKQRNQIEKEAAKIINRPFLLGHLGEHIASKLFGIRLNDSASYKGHDGFFSEGRLKGRSVNIKFYGRKSRLLDMQKVDHPDYYLVLMGSSEKKEYTCWDIETVYLFETNSLLSNLEGRKIGPATSVRKVLWEDSMIYPSNNNDALIIDEQMLSILKLFEPAKG